MPTDSDRAAEWRLAIARHAGVLEVCAAILRDAARQPDLIQANLMAAHAALLAKEAAGLIGEPGVENPVAASEPEKKKRKGK